jgi:hypothetical protein
MKGHDGGPELVMSPSEIIHVDKLKIRKIKMYNLHVKWEKRMTNVIFYLFSDVIFIRQQFEFGFSCYDMTHDLILKRDMVFGVS